MGCIREIKLLVSKLFQGLEGCSKRSLGPSFAKCNMATKRVYLSKKGSCISFWPDNLSTKCRKPRKKICQNL